MDTPIVGGRYELHEQIGSGAAATVWRATDQVLRRPVAVKILKNEAAGNPAFVERFRREARAAASLNHPNVVAVYDWGQADPEGNRAHSVYYMVMEYVPGSDLKRLIERSAPLPEPDALAIGQSIASALEAAHERGIIHRDIKPQNVLLRPDGRVVVTDFGIAWNPELTDLTLTNAINGTVLYAAPEQVRGQRADRRSDIYSLGVVLYELLTGRVPFTGSTALDVALHHIQDPPVPPRQLNPNISPATEQVILTALAKSPPDRFGSAAQMRDALVRAQAPPEVPVAVPAAVESTAPAARRLPPTRPPVRSPRARPPRTEEHEGSGLGRWVVALPLLLLALIGGAVLVTHGAGNPVSAPPTAKPRATGGVAQAPSKSHASARTASRPRPRATSVSTPKPTAAPPPAAAPVPQPTAEPTIPSSGRVVSANTGASTPTAAVMSFYAVVSEHYFGRAASFWTDHMRAEYPPPSAIDQRFAGTSSITVRDARVVSLDNASGNATVAVDVIEQTGAGTTRWVGTWQVALGPNGWLLDQPDLHSA